MEKITLNFRRGGEWNREPDRWYAVRLHQRANDIYDILGPRDGVGGWETSKVCFYAELPPFEIVEPDPEPLRIPGYEEPAICQVADDRWIVRCHLSDGSWAENPMRVHGPTRRAAIEAYNAAAKVMGGK